jgi:hypothetical protein
MAGFNKTLRRAKRGASRVLISTIIVVPLLAAPASAQWFYEGIIPPHAIGRIVMRHGYSGFSPPRLAGDVYIVHAVDVDGARVRLVIDAHDGRILRPVRAVERLAPPRRVERVRPREYEVEIEREYVRRPRSWGPTREALLPPQPIPEDEPIVDLRSREAEVDPRRGERAPAPSGVDKPVPKSRAARAEQPAREPSASGSRTKQREAARPAPAVTPAAPAPVVEAPKPAPAADAKPAATAAAPAPAAPKETAPAAPSPVVEAPKPEQPAEAKPAVTAAAPAPAAPVETAPSTPAAPAPTIEPAKPEAAKPEASQSAAAQSQSAAVTPSTPRTNVRVIQGVIPVPGESTTDTDKDSSTEPKP